MLFHLLLPQKTTVGYFKQYGSCADDFVLLPPAKSYFLIWQECFGKKGTKLQWLLIKAFAYNSDRGIISE